MSNMHAFTACSLHSHALHHPGGRGGGACQQLKCNDSPVTEQRHETTWRAGDKQEIMWEGAFLPLFNFTI